MTAILVDKNLEGQAALLWQTLVSEGWLELEPLDFVTLAMVGLADNSSDRVIWRFAQERRMLLLTNNRNAKGKDSLGQTIAEEATEQRYPYSRLAISTG